MELRGPRSSEWLEMEPGGPVVRPPLIWGDECGYRRQFREKYYEGLVKEMFENIFHMGLTDSTAVQGIYEVIVAPPPWRDFCP